MVVATDSPAEDNATDQSLNEFVEGRHYCVLNFRNYGFIISIRNIYVEKKPKDLFWTKKFKNTNITLEKILNSNLFMFFSWMKIIGIFLDK